MTKDELEELISDCPTLFHMAERGSWASIQRCGLLSTSALLDRYKVTGSRREIIESCRRPQSVKLQAKNLPEAVVRDQIPMDDAGLLRCLPKHISPRDWYQLLNKKVFFWLNRSRLYKLTGAKAYRDKYHDVIEVDTASIISSYREQIWLCPMNSGNTKPFPHKRDENTFLRIRDYPYDQWRQKRQKGERVVELAIDYSVPDLARFVKRVTVVNGKNEVDELYRSP